MPFYGEVQGHVGYVEGNIYHLWHGSVENRQYDGRFSELARFAFDPYSDISLDDNGLWRWSSDKSDMHQYLLNYFGARREDG